MTTRYIRHAVIAATAAGLLVASWANAALARTVGSGATVITLGTNSGPLPNPRRSEPALLLRSGDQAILIDAGDGVVQQLGKANVDLDSIRTVVISHLHFDHIGGLFALLALQYQLMSTGEVTIYGPPGTKGLVAGMIAAMNASTAGASNMRARMPGAPGDNIKVVELADGSRFATGDIKVTVAANSHFSTTPTTSNSAPGLSLAYRFDTPTRSIVYTGDTGPSQNVETLARNADILFCEIFDPDAAVAALKLKRPNLSPSALENVADHFRKEHLRPTDVGLLAKGARAKALVLVHIGVEPRKISAARRAVATNYRGPITFATDLSVF